MTADLLLTFALMALLVCLSPGPAVVLTTGQAMRGGLGAGLAVAAGIECANLVWFGATVLGLGAVLLASETAFALVRYAGAAYLFYLGIRMIARAGRAGPPLAPARVTAWRHPFTQGAVNQLANPKAILFWSAIVPQFVVPAAGALPLQFGLLALVAAMINLAVLGGYAWLAARGARWLGQGKWAVWRERLSGVMLMGVGAALALARR